MANATMLRVALAYHVVPNVVLTLDQLRGVRLLPTASGQIIQVSTAGITIRVNNGSSVSHS